MNVSLTLGDPCSRSRSGEPKDDRRARSPLGERRLMQRMSPRDDRDGRQHSRPNDTHDDLALPAHRGRAGARADGFTVSRRIKEEAKRHERTRMKRTSGSRGYREGPTRSATDARWDRIQVSGASAPPIELQRASRSAVVDARPGHLFRTTPHGRHCGQRTNRGRGPPSLGHGRLICVMRMMCAAQRGKLR